LTVKEQSADEAGDHGDKPHDFVNKAATYSDDDENSCDEAENNVECVHGPTDKLKRREFVLALWMNGAAHRKRLLF
jgi:hypothetical protein